jgi:hypothetical protein
MLDDARKGKNFFDNFSFTVWQNLQ